MPSLPLFQRRFEHSLLLIGAILTVALAWLIRSHVATEPLWLDELHTGWVVDGDTDQLVERSLVGNQSPLYFLLVQTATQHLGNNAYGLRFVSFVSGMLLIIACGAGVFYLTHNFAACLGSSMIAAVNEHFVYYSAEARCYSLLQLVFVVQLILVLGWIRGALRETPTSTRFSWTTIFQFGSIVVFSCLLFYLHYSTILILFAEFIVAMGVALSFKSSRTRILVPATLIFIVESCLCWPGTRHCLQTIQKDYDWHLVSDAIGFLESFALALFACIVIPLSLILVGKVFSSTSTETKSNGRQWPLMYGLLFISLAPPAFILMVSVLNIAHLDQLRYAVCSATSLVILAGMLISKCDERYGLQLICVLLVFFTTAAMNLQVVDPGAVARNENWELAIQEVNRELGDQNQPVLVFPNLVEDSYYATHATPRMNDYYRFPIDGTFKLDTNTEFYSAGRSLERQPFLTANDIQQTVDARRCIILLRGDVPTREMVEFSIERQLSDLGFNVVIDTVQVAAPGVEPTGPLYLMKLRLE